MRLSISSLKQEILAGYGVTGADKATQDICLELMRRLENLTEVMKEVVTAPYEDSDLESLFHTLRCRAVQVMGDSGAHVPLELKTHHNECGAV